MITAMLVLAGCSGGSAANAPLVFAAIPTEESTSLEQSFTPVIKMLSKETGREIRFQKATDYATVIEAQRAGRVDIAMYGPLSYVMARNSGLDLTPAGALVKERGGQQGYRSYGVVKAGSNVRSLVDARGKKVCFVEPNSTSGRLYPAAALKQAGVDPDKDISPVMAGGHDASVLAVASGQCDIGFAYDAMVDRQLPDKNQIKPGEITKVWQSDVIPGSPAAVRSSLEPKLRDQLVQLLREKANGDYLRSQGYCTDKCLVGDGGYWGFVQVDDAFYNSVRTVCAVTKDKQCQ
ncbi:phosphate/phosphite/phosphonate ABC transporter substrate-binding protein [Pseudonocardiaceae bacterium YIM PH 21723]|nr:phosphate/phosphite/phosphonate ABC transporter substrate-binding protein [Pseudonocardiaceae bacterium YIM PH 21723]